MDDKFGKRLARRALACIAGGLVCVLAILMAVRAVRGGDEMSIAVTAAVLAVVAAAMALVFALIERYARAGIRRAEEDKARQAEEIGRLEELARHDAGTGLYNYPAAAEKMRAYLAGAGKDGYHALILAELTSGGRPLDELDFETARAVEADAGAAVKNFFFERDILCHKSGGQFLMLLENIYSQEIISMRVEQMCALLQFTYCRGGVNADIVCAAGVAIWGRDDPANTFERLLAGAESALAAQKKESEQGFRMCVGAGESFAPASGVNIQLAKLLNNMDCGVMVLEAGDEVGCVYRSPNCARLLQASGGGGAPADAVLPFVSSEDYALVDATIKKCASTGAPVEAVCRVQDDVWYQLRAVNLSEQRNGHPLLLTVITDVSSMRRGDLETRLERMRNELIRESSRIATFELDIPTRTASLSDALLSMYDLPAASAEGVPESHPAPEFIRPACLPVYLSIFDDIYAGEPEGEQELDVRSRISHEFIHVRVAWKNVFDDHGTAQKTVGVVEPLVQGDESGLQSENSALKAQLTLQETYFRRADEYLKTIRKYRHDRKNNITALTALLDKDDLPGAKKYLADMGEIIRRDSGMINTGNPSVDAILSEKIAAAQKAGIKVEHRIGLPPDVPIDMMDLCLAVGCCLDNAIESCQRVAPDGAGTAMDIQLLEKQGAIIFKLANSAVPAGANEGFATVKKDRQNHGFGLTNVRSVVDKYGGQLRLDQEDGTFRTSFMLFPQMAENSGTEMRKP